MQPRRNFIESLADAVAGQPLREKILLAPSHRVGRQWLDRVALRLGGVANVRATPLRRLMLDLAEPLLLEKGLRQAGPEEKTRLVGEALAGFGDRNREGGYFTRLPLSLNLSETLLSALEEMETAGVAGLRRKFASREKEDELVSLWRVYREGKKRAGLAGPDDVGVAAVEALRRRNGETPLLLAPESIWSEADAREKTFLAEWPQDHRLILHDGSEDMAARLVFWTADSVTNEAREVFRRVQELGVELDRAEVICLDPDGYGAALVTAGIEAFGSRVEDLPIAFNAGVPASFSRPARLLLAWLDWLDLDLPPNGLADIVESGLLGEDWRNDAPKLGAADLAARIRALPVNAGPGEYRAALGSGRNNALLRKGELWLAKALSEILPLANGGEELNLKHAPAVLDAARGLLSLGAEKDGKLDAYARRALKETVAAWLPHCGWRGFDALAWLRTTTVGMKVMGLGSQPGKLLVTDIYSGGHSGREFTFVLGMDDSRYPGTVRQDPVLLDKERHGLSKHLPPSRQRRERREAAMRRLLGRLEGEVWVSHAQRDAGRGRDLFPAALYTRLRDGDDAKREGATAVLLPVRAAHCLNRRDDWLYALLRERVDGAAEPTSLGPWFEHLERGARAMAERESSRFTEWDGFVPEAGADFVREEWVLSPTDLELLATCPMEFLFRKVLGVKAPERYEYTPGRWLEGNERGSLLHDLFYAFVDELRSEGQTVDAADLKPHEHKLVRMLEKALQRQKKRKPPRDELAYLRDRRELMDACVIFLATEALRQTAMRPLCLEAALGGAKADAPPWQRCEAIRLDLPEGDRLWLKGRVDRIDRLHNHGGLRIWDYKTARSGDFSRTEPFQQGRHLQPLLYTEMLERVTREAGIPEPVEGFSYLFPMPRDEGREVFYPREALRSGMWIVEKLSALLRAGCFPFTTDWKDVVYSDYAPVYGDAGRLAAQARRKTLMDSPLENWAELRNLTAEEEQA